jgi:hypothetical protein
MNMSSLGEKVSEDLHLRLLGADDIVNFSARGRDLTAADVQAVRAALAEMGYDEAKSWVATEGMSWLSDGVRSVSIQVREVRS